MSAISYQLSDLVCSKLPDHTPFATERRRWNEDVELTTAVVCSEAMERLALAPEPAFPLAQGHRGAGACVAKSSKPLPHLFFF
jgi:hypothetical protein